MDDSQAHRISEDIGGLKKSVELMTDLWKTQEASATLGRRALHEKFESFRDEIRLQMQGFSLRLDRMADQVKMIEPSVQGFNDEKLRGEGAKRLGVRIYAALLAGASIVGWGAHEFISWIRHP